MKPSYIEQIWLESVFKRGTTLSVTSQCLEQSKKDGKDQEPKQSSTTPDPGYQMGK